MRLFSNIASEIIRLTVYFFFLVKINFQQLRKPLACRPLHALKEYIILDQRFNLRIHSITWKYIWMTRHGDNLDGKISMTL